MKINIHDMIVKCMCIIPLITLFSRYSLVSPINRMLTAVMLLLLLYSILSLRDKKTTIVLFLFFIGYTYCIIQTKWPIGNINEIFYLIFWILLLNDVVIAYDQYIHYFNKNLSLIKGVAFIWNFFVVISLFLPSSYEGSTFFSFTGGQHRFASCALQILAMVLMCVKANGQKKHIILAIFPVLTVMLTGARTYQLVVGVASICIYYMISKHKYSFYFTIGPIVAIAVYLITNSSVMIERAEDTAKLSQYYGDNFRALTSGRSIWWAIDMEHFFDSSIVNQMFGNGFHFIRYVNINFYGQNIWAHNDFIQLLGTNGYLGFVLYLFSYFRLFSFAIKKTSIDRKKLLFLGFHTMNFLNAFLNMLYTYFCSTLALVFFLILFFDDQNFVPISRKDNDSHPDGVKL